MVEFIFDLQRFQGGDGGGSSSGASGGGTGGSSSGGSNAKTDGDTVTEEVEVWVDDWAGYETKLRSALATEAYSLLQTIPAATYIATELADNIPVLGHENNVIYDLDRFDTVSFVDLNLESFATFYNYTKYNNYVDLVFDAKTPMGSDSGTVTRLYLSGLNIDNPLLVGGNFTPVLSFASGLNVVYNFDLEEWFGSDELAVAANFWGNNFLSNYDAASNTVTTSINGTLTDIFQSNMVFASRDINNFITGVPSDISNFMNGVNRQNGIYFYDTSPAELTFTQKTDTGLAMTFSNGTGALVQYDGDFSPTFYFSDGTAYIYNSKADMWRTVEEAWADKTAYDLADTQTNVDNFTRDVAYTNVYNAADWDENQAFPASRWVNTEIYGTTLTNDIFFNDAAFANVVDVIHEDDSHFDIVFDTGAVTRIEYADIVSPVLHFMDGNFVFDLGVKNQTSILETDYTTGFISAFSGTRYDSGAGTAVITPNTNTSIATNTRTDTNTGITGTGGTGMGGTGVKDQNSLNSDHDTSSVRQGEATRVVDLSFEGYHDAFPVSRYNDTFINKVTAQDDIYLVDAAFENISNFNITRNYDIILEFDTDKQLRVRDASIISPTFHFADGTSAAYNWRIAQWVGVTEAGDFNNGITDNFVAGAFTNNFFRNVEGVDVIYIPDATLANVADIYDDDENYLNITFDTGASTAVRYAEPVRYSDQNSPLIVFADGTTYQYRGKTQIFYGDEDLSRVDTFDLSKDDNNTTVYMGSEDTINFYDALSSDVAAITCDDWTITFTFKNGNTTMVDYWENYSPLFTFADGVTLRYSHDTGNWNNSATTGGVTIGNYEGYYYSIDHVYLDKNYNNSVTNVRTDDYITFVNANRSDVTGIFGSTDNSTYNDTVMFTFDTGTGTAIEYTSLYSPIIQFADGSTYQYYIFYDGTYTEYVAYLGTDGADQFSLDGNVANRVLNAGATDTIFINKNYADDPYEYISTYSSSPYINFGFGSKYTYIYYDLDDQGLTPNIVFADGKILRYNTYKDNSSIVDNVMISSLNNSIVYNLGNAGDTVSVVDASFTDVDKFDTSSSYRATLEFKNGNTATIGLYSSTDPLTVFFADGQISVYNPATKAWTHSATNPINPETPTEPETSTNIRDGNTAVAETVNLSKSVYNVVNNISSNDIINITDANYSDILSINYNNKAITLNFDTGTTLVLNCTDDFSPILHFADNSNYGIDTVGEYFGKAYDASALSDGRVEVNMDDNSLIYNGDSLLQIHVTDATADDYSSYNWSITRPYYRFDFEKNTGATASVIVSYDNKTDFTLSADGGSSPSIYGYTGIKADPTKTESFALNTTNNNRNVIVGANSADTVTFTGRSTSEASVDVDTTRTYVYLDNHLAAVINNENTSVSYTPEFVFDDGTYRYNYTANEWEEIDSAGNATTLSVSPFTSSADLAESADLWGDTVDETLFAGGTIATDATLSNLISAPVDNAAVSFNAETAFDLNTSGALVAVSAYLATRKTA